MLPRGLQIMDLPSRHALTLTQITRLSGAPYVETA